MLTIFTDSESVKTVLFADGTSARHIVYLYQGACLAGRSTAYVYRDGKLVWVRPGESCDWVESDK